jgi:hypothetical protein
MRRSLAMDESQENRNLLRDDAPRFVHVDRRQSKCALKYSGLGLSPRMIGIETMVPQLLHFITIVWGHLIVKSTIEIADVGFRAVTGRDLPARAGSRGGKFVTLDQGIGAASVTGGSAALEIIPCGS